MIYLQGVTSLMITLDINHQDYKTALESFIRAVQDYSKLECTILFGTDHAQSKIIRDIIGTIFTKNNVHAPWRGRFVLVADELINNAIEHGSRPGDIDTCTIASRIENDGSFYMSLEVHDTGNGKYGTDVVRMNEIKQKSTTVGRGYMWKRGRGLFHITEKLVDSLSFRTSPHGWLAVKIEKTIPR